MVLRSLSLSTQLIFNILVACKFPFIFYLVIILCIRGYKKAVGCKIIINLSRNEVVAIGALDRK